MRKIIKKRLTITRREFTLALIAVSLAFGICAALEAAGTSRKPVRTVATPSPKIIYVTPAPATPEPTPTLFFSNTTAWATYQSTKEPDLSFDYPLAWNVKVTGGSDPGNPDGIEINSPSGTRIMWSSYVQGLGGGCPLDDQTNPSLFITRVTAVPGAAGLYAEDLSDRSHKLVRIGVVNSANGQPPQVGPTDCLHYTLFTSRTRKYGSNSEPVRMWLQASNIAPNDIATVRRVLGSLKY